MHRGACVTVTVCGSGCNSLDAMELKTPLLLQGTGGPTTQGHKTSQVAQRCAKHMRPSRRAKAFQELGND